MKSVKVTCDGCGHDLTTRTNIEDYRLVLDFESKPGYGAGAYTAMGINPPIDRRHDFCGLGCLDQWRDRERHREKVMGEEWQKWKDERGTKNTDGTVYCFPSPPDAVHAEWQAKSQAAAIEAFPMENPGRGKRKAA